MAISMALPWVLEERWKFYRKLPASGCIVSTSNGNDIEAKRSEAKRSFDNKAFSLSKRN
jgi:hypothetical protein